MEQTHGFFVHTLDIPDDVTYPRIVADIRESKEDPYRTCISLRNLINYPGDCSTPTVDLVVVKLLINRILSTPGAKFMNLDAKNFHYQTPM